ncbi:MAG TPA: PAS domain S-box protein [Kofleriaceae bacterium]|nr:PAS domain S-box protein [Kofleriaceae bacterium]
METKIKTSSSERRLEESLITRARSGAAPAELFRLLVTSVRDYAILMLDPRGFVVTWNAGAERVEGYTAQEIIGRHFSTFYLADDVAGGKCERELAVAAAEGRFEDEGWRVRKDGSRFWANVVITAVRDTDDRLIGFAEVTRDLTERKHADDVRLAAEERYRFLIESVKDYAVFMLDPQGRVATWNPGAERIKQYRADEIIGSHFSRFYPPEEAYKCAMELDVAARDGRFEDEGWRVRKDGSKFWANVVITPVRDSSGALIGFAKVTRDLTERKRAEDDRTARLAAEQANKTKDEFLAMLGHELRNPLAPIVTALQLIKLRGDSRSSKEHQVIERQVMHMMHLVDDLLDVSRITRGKIELKKKHVDLRHAIGKAIEIASPLFEQRRHQFDVRVPPTPFVVDGDEPRLTQVFANLLTNAAKYTEPGGHITMTLSRAGGEIVVDVTDDGTGITPELLPHVFEMFVQGYQTPERSVGGLGLGLALVKSLIGLHGGQVQARSAGRDKGSTFTIRIPAVEQPVSCEASGPFAAAVPHGADKLRILIVDDNDDACMLLAEILRAVGHDVKTAGDGLEALKLVDQTVVDIAILDIGLPVMDGYELAGRLLARPDAPRLVAVSGYGRPADLARSAAAGFVRHLVKPVDLRRLMATLDELKPVQAAR